MSYQETANELIKKYSFCITTHKGTSIMSREIAIQCALICCDEMISETGLVYWKDVRKSIEKSQTLILSN